MTTNEAAIVATYTGYLIGEFDDMHKYIEKLLKRPVWTHELGNKRLYDEIRDLAKPDFIAMKITKEEETK